MPARPPPSLAEPLRVKLSDADDRIHLNHWMPPQQGIAPRIRIGQRWINTLWGLPIAAAALLCLIAVAQSLREIPGVEAFIRQHPGIAQAAPSVDFGLSVVVAASALPEHVPYAVHHAGRAANSGRPSTALLGPRLHAGDRLVPLPGSGAEGARLDRQGRFRHSADMARHSGPAPYPWAVALVAFLGQPAVADQRRCFLRAAVFNRSMAQTLYR